MNAVSLYSNIGHLYTGYFILEYFGWLILIAKPLLGCDEQCGWI